MINDEHLVSGADDGYEYLLELFVLIPFLFRSIALWSVSKRRPLFNLPHAHKLTSTDPSLDPPSFPEDFWITSLASLRYTDLLASGSFNGTIHLWKSTPEFNHLSPLFTLSEVDLSLRKYPSLKFELFRLVLSMIWNFHRMEIIFSLLLVKNIDLADGGR